MYRKIYSHANSIRVLMMMVYILSFTLSKSGTPRLCTSLICLLITDFTPAKFV